MYQDGEQEIHHLTGHRLEKTDYCLEGE